MCKGDAKVISGLARRPGQPGLRLRLRRPPGPASLTRQSTKKTMDNNNQLKHKSIYSRDPFLKGVANDASISSRRSYLTDSARKLFTGSKRFQDNTEIEYVTRVRPQTSMANASLQPRPKSLSFLIHKCDPGSDSYPTTRELDYPDEWQKPTSVSDRPARYQLPRPNSVHSQSSCSSFQIERVGWNQRCLAALYGKEKGFRSPITFLESKLRELHSKDDTGKDFVTSERTADACDLLHRLCPSMGRLGELLKEIAHELFRSIYVDYVAPRANHEDFLNFSTLSSFFSANKLQIQVIRSLQVIFFRYFVDS